jgi:hypothetical protein
MARQYVITEEEMLSLIESLEMVKLREAGHFRGTSDEDFDKFKLDDMHRRFHMVTVRWAQKMGFDGYRK